jgi:2-polyprenyl-3-methyl-5-hydroxy-6-metoxy-1,4-benzoquinol methylase
MTSTSDSFGAREAARCYRLYRPPFPQALLDDLLARANVTPSHSLLDLACGPGRVAIPLAPSFAHVTAVDLEPAMIAEAQTAAAERAITNVSWQIAKAEDTAAAPATFQLVTIGDALHRFDQPAILAKVRTWLAPGGSIAVLRSLDTLSGAEPWHRIVTDAVTKWTGRDTAKLTAPTQTTDECEAILNANGFRDVSSHHFTTPYAWSIEAILGNLASTSFYAKHILGPIADNFTADVTAALKAIAPDGTLRETLTFSTTIARV